MIIFKKKIKSFKFKHSDLLTFTTIAPLANNFKILLFIKPFVNFVNGVEIIITSLFFTACLIFLVKKNFIF